MRFKSFNNHYRNHCLINGYFYYKNMSENQYRSLADRLTKLKVDNKLVKSWIDPENSNIYKLVKNNSNDTYPRPSKYHFVMYNIDKDEIYSCYPVDELPLNYEIKKGLEELPIDDDVNAEVA